MLRFVLSVLTITNVGCAHSLFQEVIPLLEFYGHDQTALGVSEIVILLRDPHQNNLIYEELLEVYLWVVTNKNERLGKSIAVLKSAIAKCDEHPSEQEIHKNIYARALQLLLELEQKYMQHILRPVHYSSLEPDRFMKKRHCPAQHKKPIAPSIRKVDIQTEIDITVPLNTFRRFGGDNPFAPDSWVE